VSTYNDRRRIYSVESFRKDGRVSYDNGKDLSRTSTLVLTLFDHLSLVWVETSLYFVFHFLFLSGKNLDRTTLGIERCGRVEMVVYQETTNNASKDCPIPPWWTLSWCGCEGICAKEPVEWKRLISNQITVDERRIQPIQWNLLHEGAFLLGIIG